MTSWNSQPSIYLGTIRIDEPSVLLTNLLITAVCWFAFFRLKKSGLTGSAQTYFRFYFLLMGAATVLGGFFGHAFNYAFGLPWKIPGWTMSMIGVTMFSLASIETVRPLINSRTTRFLFILNAVELFAAFLFTISTVNFKWVEFHSTYNMIGVVMPLHAYNYYKTSNKGSLTILWAIAVISLTAIVFLNKISLGPWFNHLDVSHVFMATGTYMFYRGVLLLKVKV